MNQQEEIGEVIESRTFHQLGILILDGSGSMATIGEGMRPIADNVNFAVREFLGYFKRSSIANNFSIAVITFDNEARIHTSTIELTKVDDFADYNPMNGHGGGTYIGRALELAEQLSTDFLSRSEGDSIPLDVRFIVMSDGLCLAPAQTKVIADRLKLNDKIMICSTLFSDPNKVGDSDVREAKSVLVDIASSANLYKTAYGEADLRQFFISSMSAKKKFINE